MKTTAVLLLSASLAMAVFADSDQDEARRAYEAGEIVSLLKVLDAVQAEFEGEVIEVELERDGGRWIYEVDLLTRDSRVLELTYDAATARLETEGKSLDTARRKK